ncbi:hypothetical protein FLAG1_09395 [Fusarium langsethiae]|uniref:Uncharacterized protein n=1 Tax=Fusarium langsethiae TaxID=179993 RepID=A0A0N0DC69_FUSLA|nr:hypothetical protein FLAG1_09395 [Fusarium langsethiae]GKU07749.1 unnamed protein product [Fusarium langsethiae]GKU22840.1 unnamed protein product [Fusarium langsethiae]
MKNSMDRSLKRAEEAQQVAYETFFVDGKGPEGGAETMVMDQIKDQMSKYLNVPWNQIDVKQMKKWGDKGFAKVKADEWSKPNDVERAHFLKMLAGGSLRKEL